jgi:hypothetical protein
LLFLFTDREIDPFQTGHHSRKFVQRLSERHLGLVTDLEQTKAS